MSYRSLVWAVILAVLAFTAPFEAGAQIPKERAKCAKAAGSAAGKYFKSAAKLLAKCEDAVSKGKLGAGVDCEAEAA